MRAVGRHKTQFQIRVCQLLLRKESTKHRSVDH